METLEDRQDHQFIRQAKEDGKGKHWRNKIRN